MAKSAPSHKPRSKLNAKKVKAKLFRKCGFISTLQNLERAKNGDCIGIRCGLGQSGVDDGAGGRMVGHGREKPE